MFAGLLAVSVVSVSAVLTGAADAAVAGRQEILAMTAATVAATAIRFLVRAAPVAAALDPRGRESVLLVGDLQSLRETITAWRQAGSASDIVGVCLTESSGPSVGTEVEGVSVLGGLVDAPAAALRSAAHTVAVLPGPGVHGESLRKLGWALEPSGVELSLLTPLLDVAQHRARTDAVGRQLLVRVSHSVPAGVNAGVKTTLDRAFAGLLLVVALPVLAAIAVSIRLDSAGPALFRQQRVREGGRAFTILKFRTMRTDAEEAQAALTALNDHGNGILFKMRNDPRITRVGRVLRATSLDELPQLVNVLRGEMSLVGPRPALPSEVAQYDEVARRRLAVKPGLTGLWQVSGRSNLSWDESLRMDLAYVDNWRHGVDFGILARTVKAVVRRDGAC
jgi:exopolysaccharide biosynthesis polyprenyl glycosylphosphotransferase